MDPIIHYQHDANVMGGEEEDYDQTLEEMLKDQVVASALLSIQRGEYYHDTSSAVALTMHEEKELVLPPALAVDGAISNEETMSIQNLTDEEKNHVSVTIHCNGRGRPKGLKDTWKRTRAAPLDSKLVRYCQVDLIKVLSFVFFGVDVSEWRITPEVTKLFTITHGGFLACKSENTTLQTDLINYLRRWFNLMVPFLPLVLLTEEEASLTQINSRLSETQTQYFVDMMQEMRAWMHRTDHMEQSTIYPPVDFIESTVLPASKIVGEEGLMKRSTTLNLQDCDLEANPTGQWFLANKAFLASVGAKFVGKK